MSTQDNIRKLRENQKLSQDDMADKLGMSKNGYGKIERGQSDLSLTRLKQIADIFGVDMVEIIKHKEMVLIGENRDVIQNNYTSDNAEIDKLKLIIKHQQERIDDLKEMLAQKDELIQTLKQLKSITDLELAEL